LSTSVECIVKIFATFTYDGFGSVPSTQSLGPMATARSSGSCDVIATRTRSSPCSLKAFGEMTNAGRRFEEVRSVKGKETRTMSPRL
jgi:hypothetical protein